MDGCLKPPLIFNLINESTSNPHWILLIIDTKKTATATVIPNGQAVVIDEDGVPLMPPGMRPMYPRTQYSTGQYMGGSTPRVHAMPPHHHDFSQPSSGGFDLSVFGTLVQRLHDVVNFLSRGFWGTSCM